MKERESEKVMKHTEAFHSERECRSNLNGAILDFDREIRKCAIRRPAVVPVYSSENIELPFNSTAEPSA